MTQLQETRLGVVTATEALAAVDDELRAGNAVGRSWATGFIPLDAHLQGGLQAGDLVLLAGSQGTGKTTLSLQVARNVCAAGGSAVVVCYEHTPAQLLERVLVLEAALAAGFAAPTQEEVRSRLARGGGGSVASALSDLPGMAGAVAAVSDYGGRLQLVPARGDTTGLDEIRALARSSDEPSLIVVDYLQKVFARDTDDEDVRVARIGSALKDVALETGCPVLALTSVERHGLDAPRIRARHLKGSVALAYEADVVLVLQNKYDIVARQHLMYDLTAAEEHQHWMVCTLEKNRRGEDHLELEFRKRFSHGSFDPRGRVVAEQLVDERVHQD